MGNPPSGSPPLYNLYSTVQHSTVPYPHSQLHSTPSHPHEPTPRRLRRKPPTDRTNPPRAARKVQSWPPTNTPHPIHPTPIHPNPSRSPIPLTRAYSRASERPSPGKNSKHPSSQSSPVPPVRYARYTHRPCRGGSNSVSALDGASLPHKSVISVDSSASATAPGRTRTAVEL